MEAEKMRTYFKVLQKIVFLESAEDSGYPGLISTQAQLEFNAEQKFCCEFSGESTVLIITPDLIKYSLEIVTLARMILSGQILETGICEQGGEHNLVTRMYGGGWSRPKLSTRCCKCNSWIKTHSD